MRFLLFVVVVLGLTVGCKTSRPAVFSCNNDTVKVTDTIEVEIKDKDIINSFLECDSNYTIQWIENAYLLEKIDSLKNIPIKFVIKKQTIYRDSIRTNEIVKVYKPEVIEVKKVHPLTWVAFSLMFLFLIAFIISTLLLFKKMQKDGQSSTS